MERKSVFFALFILLIGGFFGVNCDSLPRDEELTPEEFEGVKGSTFQHQISSGSFSYNLKECTLSSSSVVIELYPKHNATDSAIQFEPGSIFTQCNVKIDPLDSKHDDTWILQGLYTISTTDGIVENLISQKFTLKVKDELEEPLKAIKTIRGGTVWHEMTSHSLFQTTEDCTVKTNNEVSSQLYPEFQATDGNIKHYTTSSFSPGCGVQISNITKEYLGNWELRATISSPNKIIQSQKLDIQIYEKINTIPINTIVYEGADVTVSLSETVENHKCTWKSPLNQEIVINTADSCILKITNVTLEDTGTWVGTSQGDITLYGNFNLIVNALPKIEKSIFLKQGSSGILEFGPSQSVLCYAISPMGEAYPHSVGECKINIETMKSKHNGIWQAHVSLPGKMNTVIYYYDVKVTTENLEQINTEKVTSNISISTDSINISCSMIVSSLSSCHMVRSDGKVLSLYEAVGFEHYSYFGESEKNSDGTTSVTCGMTIEKPTEVDKKNWKCLIVHGNNQESSTSINIEKVLEPIDVNKQVITLNTEKIEITKDNSFELKCSYPDKIKYCWFLTPNRTTISPNQGEDNDVYEYFGNGLDAGECGIKVKKASIADTGSWTCNMGVDYFKDLQSKFDVNIYSDVLIPIRSLMEIERGLTIGCKTFDNSSVDYCRFIRPDGTGINTMEASSTYGYGKTNLNTGICQLEIIDPYYVDIGLWRCAAKSSFETKEYESFVVVYQNYYYVSSLYTVLWVLLIMTLLTLVVLACASKPGRRMRYRSTEFARSFSFRKENLNSSA